MADRRAELERKRQKLALIRAQKENNRRREQPTNPIVSVVWVRLNQLISLLGSLGELPELSI